MIKLLFDNEPKSVTLNIDTNKKITFNIDFQTSEDGSYVGNSYVDITKLAYPYSSCFEPITLKCSLELFQSL